MPLFVSQVRNFKRRNTAWHEERKKTTPRLRSSWSTGKENTSATLAHNQYTLNEQDLQQGW